MLTRKQKWRKVSRRGKATLKCSAVDAIVNDGSPKSINSLSIGDSLLQLLGAKAVAANRKEPKEKEDSPSKDGRGHGGRGCGGTIGAKSRCVHRMGRVAFNQQVRVVLIPSRPELEGIKADLWWEEDDYFNFRREYILAVKAAGHHNIEDLDIAAPAAPTSLSSSAVEPYVEATKPFSGEVTTADVPRESGLLPRPPDASPSFPPQLPPETNAPPPPPQQQQQQRQQHSVRQAPFSKRDLDVAPAVLAAPAPYGGEAAASVASIPVSSSTQQQQQQQCHRLGANATFIPAAAARGVAMTAPEGVPPVRVRREGGEAEAEAEVKPRQAMPLRRPPLTPLAGLGVVAAKSAATNVASSVEDAHGDDRNLRTQSMSSNSEGTDPESLSGSGSDSDGEGVGVPGGAVGDGSPGCDGCLEEPPDGKGKRSARRETG